MILTSKQLLEIYPKANVEFISLINTYAKTMCSTKENLAMFLCQTLHESNGWWILSESFNYKATTLVKVFPKKFKTQTDAQLAINKGSIYLGDMIYGNRMGNSEKGDGYKYRGRGILQVTGKDNYKLMNKALNEMGYSVDLICNPDLLKDPRYALLSTLIFWNENKLYNMTDVTKVTKIINGGSNGLTERKALYQKALNVLSK